MNPILLQPFIYLLIAIVSAVVCMYSFKTRRIEGVLYLGYGALVFGLWSMLSMAEYFALDYIAKKNLFYLRETLYSFLSPFFYLFIFHFTREFKHINKIFRWFVFAYPVVAITAVVLNINNEILFKVTPDIIDYDSSNYLNLSLNPNKVYFFVKIYSEIIDISSLFMLIRALTNSYGKKRRIILMIAIGMLMTILPQLYVLFFHQNLNYIPYLLAFGVICALCFNFTGLIADQFRLDPDALLAQFDIGIIVLDGEKRIIEISDKAVDFIRIDRNDLISQPIFFLFSSILDEPFEKIFSELKKGVVQEVRIHDNYYLLKGNVLDLEDWRLNQNTKTLNNSILNALPPDRRGFQISLEKYKSSPEKNKSNIEPAKNIGSYFKDTIEISIELLPFAFWELDDKLKVVRSNKEAQKIWIINKQLEHEDDPSGDAKKNGNSILDQIPDYALKKRILDATLNCMRNLSIVNETIEVIRNEKMFDKKYFYEVSFIPIISHYENNKHANLDFSSGVTIIAIDVTEKQRAFYEIENKNRELKSIFKVFPDALLRITGNGVIISGEAKMENGIFSDPSRFVFQNINTFLPPVIAEEFLYSITQSIAKRTTQRYEFELREKTIRSLSGKPEAPRSLKDFIRTYEARITASSENEVIALIRDITNTVQNIKEKETLNELLFRYSSALSTLQYIGSEAIEKSGQLYEPIFNQYLEAGKRFFNLHVGAITRVIGSKITIFSISDNDDLDMGARFDIEETYCAEIVRMKKVIFFNGKNIKNIFNLPYIAQSFIGCPIHVSGEVFGVLSFWSIDKRATDFDPYQKSIIELMAKMVGMFISLQREEQHRQQTEKVLFENQARYRGLIESQNDAIIRTNTQYRITFVNQAFMDTFGFKTGSVLGNLLTKLLQFNDQKITDYLNPEYLEKSQNKIVLEAEVKTPRGFRWFLLESYAVKNEIGQVSEIQSILRDIHENIQNQKALTLNEARFRNLALNSPDHIFIIEIPTLEEIEKGTRIIFMNSDTFLGYSIDELAGTLFRDKINPDDFALIVSDWNRLVNDPEINAVSSVFRMIDSTGVYQWVEMRQRVIERRKNKRALQILLTNTIITDRKKAESQITFQATMINHVNGAVIATDLNGNILFWNRGAEDLFQFSSEEVLNKNAVEFIVPENQIQAYYKFVRGILKGQQLDGEFICKRKDQTELPLWCRFSPIQDNKGNLIAVAGVMVDISESKRVESELRSAKEAAEAAVIEKSNFLAVMSHEIRTPLNTVIGFAELLSQTKLTDEQLDYTRTVKTSGENLLSLINNILDFSKIEEGHMEIELIPLNLLTILEEVLDLFYPNVRIRNLELFLTFEQGIPAEIMGDPTRFMQVITNLCANAVKFTENGFVWIHIKKTNIKGKLFLNLSVQDTGVGIPKSKMNRLFKPFSQADNSTTRSYGGTGLGLVISKRLVNLMGGDICCNSEEGKGATFYFDIPLITELHSQNFTTEITKIKPNTELFASEDFKGKKILFINEHNFSKDIIGKQLEAWNLNVFYLQYSSDIIPEIVKLDASINPEPVLQAVNQKENIQSTHQIESSNFEALIIFQLDNDLTEFGKRIREQYPNLPIIAILNIKTQPREIKAIGNSDYWFSYALIKPLKPSRLFHSLINILAKKDVVNKRNESLNTSIRLLADDFPAKILIAEDQQINQKMIRLILNRMGYEPKIVSNGFEVIEALKNQIFDIVFMDIQMPEMDGLEATKLITNNPEIQQKPYIIAMTANALSDDKEKCLEAGMIDYITKPIKMDILAGTLKTYSSVRK